MQSISSDSQFQCCYSVRIDGRDRPFVRCRSGETHQISALFRVITIMVIAAPRSWILSCRKGTAIWFSSSLAVFFIRLIVLNCVAVKRPKARASFCWVWGNRKGQENAKTHHRLAQRLLRCLRVGWYIIDQQRDRSAADIWLARLKILFTFKEVESTL